MHRDLAWPSLSDLQPEGGFYPLTRWLAHVLCGGALAVVLAAVMDQPAQGYSLWFLPGSALAHLLLLRRRPWPGQEGPRLQASDNICSAMPAGSARGRWLVLAVLALATGLSNNLGLVLLFFPLLVFRFYSRLWVEVDLERARVFYHRTFAGLQITRDGPDLHEARAILSGLVLEVPGEPDERIVAAWVEGVGVVPLSLHGRDAKVSHELGRRWAAQLGLPHYQVQEDFKAPAIRELSDLVQWRPTLWKPLSLLAPVPGKRDAVPPGGAD